MKVALLLEVLVLFYHLILKVIKKIKTDKLQVLI